MNGRIVLIVMIVVIAVLCSITSATKSIIGVPVPTSLEVLGLS